MIAALPEREKHLMRTHQAPGESVAFLPSCLRTRSQLALLSSALLVGAEMLLGAGCGRPVNNGAG